jgi:hypothetical protein
MTASCTWSTKNVFFFCPFLSWTAPLLACCYNQWCIFHKILCSTPTIPWFLFLWLVCGDIIQPLTTYLFTRIGHGKEHSDLHSQRKQVFPSALRQARACQKWTGSRTKQSLREYTEWLWTEGSQDHKLMKQVLIQWKHWFDTNQRQTTMR